MEVANRSTFLTKEKLFESKHFAELSLDILLVHDYNWQIITINSASEEILGFKPEEVIGKRCIDLVHPEERENVQNIIAENTKKKVKYKNRILCKDGTYKWFQLNAIPIEKENRIFVVGRDVTEKERMMEQLKKSERLNLISQLAAGLGHEIRNPLQSVRGFLQLFVKKYQNEKEHLELMISELDRANHIITEFLSLSKNRSKNPVPLNLNSVVANLFPLIQVKAFTEGKDVRLDLNISANIIGDEEELKQLIINFAQNGIEAMEPQKTLTIRTASDQSYVLLTVIDEGKGIPSDVYSKIGTPFVTRKADGTGLGLAVCYSIAERHKAKIEVETSSNGTSFSVKFPKKLK
ncbi:PAS domain S-box protein [Heliorestis acidaminivorans]|uniref:histidine kinase n=1 Tax=Heliorestis acidaminivorans TaxID=553427 RepID=A0A6I0EZ50_9FIRM|nr:ATP-binding protein [Heliorestis acidaminivorans]KAB2952132.1 PAS domain S-box protein [Heliorestis acidaminivorans]